MENINPEGKTLLPFEIGASGESQTTLYLTNNRTFQQSGNKKWSKEKRELMKNTISKIEEEQPFFCQRISITLLHYTGNKLMKIVKSKLRCKSWKCPICAPLNAVEAYFKIRSVVLLNNLNYFLTLTLDPQKIPPKYFENGLNKTHKYITYLFNRLLNKVRKEHKDLKYVWVIQFQKNGNAHLHILLNVKLDINFIRNEWSNLGGGEQMRVEKVESIERVSSYVSSYISKGFKEISSGKIGFFNWEKRYMISHSCIKSKKTYIDLSKNPVLLESLRNIINMALVDESDTIYPEDV